MPKSLPILALSAACAWAAPHPRAHSAARRPAPGPADPQSQARLQSLLARFPVGAMVGFCVQDARGGEVLAEANADKNLTPASVQKLFTTWTALDLLGPERTFATTLGYTGDIRGDTLRGDLVIRGGGDPGFGGAWMGSAHEAGTIFAEWLGVLRQRGLRAVAGKVIGDGSYLEETGPNPAELYEDIGNYYGGIVSGLCFNDNIYVLRCAGAAAPGKPVKVLGWQPSHIGIARFDNRLRTGPANSGDSAFILGSPLGDTRLLVGSYPAGHETFTLKGSLPDPPATCAAEFRDYLAAHGLAFAPAATKGDSAPGPFRPLAVHRSAPLWMLVQHTNRKSDNNYAEQLLCLLGKETGRAGDYAGGLQSLTSYLVQHGFPPETFRFRDGNGLSRYNWVAPRQIVRLLALAAGRPAFAPFRNSLLGGDAGEKLERYGDGWAGRMWAKTGTLQGVCNLAGYALGEGGRLLAFAFLVNNAPGSCPEYYGTMGAALAEATRPHAP